MQFSAESMWENNNNLHYPCQQHQESDYQQQWTQYYDLQKYYQDPHSQYNQFTYQQQYQQYAFQQQQESSEYQKTQVFHHQMVTSLEKDIEFSDNVEEDYLNDLKDFIVFGKLDESINLLDLEEEPIQKVVISKNHEAAKLSDNFMESPSQQYDVSTQFTCCSQSSPQSSSKIISGPLIPQCVQLLSGQGVHLYFCELNSSQEHLEIDEILLFDDESVMVYIESHQNIVNYEQQSNGNTRVVLLKPQQQLLIKRALSYFNDTESIVEFPISVNSPGLLYFQAADQRAFCEQGDF